MKPGQPLTVELLSITPGCPPRTTRLSGLVEPSESYDRPGTIRLRVPGNTFVSVIPIKDITFASEELDQPPCSSDTSDQTWEVPSSSGDWTYMVTRVNGAWGCTCKSYEFHSFCKHIKAIQETTNP